MQHHANLLVGPIDWALQRLPKAYSKESQDVRFLEYDAMTIAHARDLISEASLKPIEKEKRVFVIVTQTILHAAQNALLKLFEEPNEHTSFYLILPREDILLPTLKSRLNVLEVCSVSSDTADFDEFLKEKYSERLKLIETKLKDEDKVWVSNIVSGLEIHSSKSKDAKLIESTLMVSRYINIKGSSKKMLLEHIALSL